MNLERARKLLDDGVPTWKVAAILGVDKSELVFLTTRRLYGVTYLDGKYNVQMGEQSVSYDDAIEAALSADAFARFQNGGRAKINFPGSACDVERSLMYLEVEPRRIAELLKGVAA